MRAVDERGKADGDRPLVVLHVDDDPMNLRVVRDILTAFGHVAVSAASGPDALQQMTRQAFDLVLMDIHMPAMAGPEVLERMRRMAGPNREVPAIALSGDLAVRKRGDYLLMGFEDFVAKPILVSALCETIARVAGRPMRPKLARFQGLKPEHRRRRPLARAFNPDLLDGVARVG